MQVAGFTRSFVIDQGTVLGMDQLFAALFNKPLTDPKRDGICTGLSMIWLARLMLMHNETPKQRQDALHSVGGYRWGGKSQDIHLGAGGAGNVDSDATWKSHYDAALKAYVLTIVGNSTVGFGCADVKGTAKAFAPSAIVKHTYRLWNVGLRTNTGNAGHMVASYASGGTLGLNRHLYFFDPNMGEYKVDTGDAAKFVEAWLTAYGTTFVGLNYLASFAVRRG